MPGYTVIQASEGIPNASQRRLRSNSLRSGANMLVSTPGSRRCTGRRSGKVSLRASTIDGRAGRAGNKLADHFRGLNRGPDRREGYFIVLKMHDVRAAVSFDYGTGNAANALSRGPAMNQIGNSGAHPGEIFSQGFRVLPDDLMGDAAKTRNAKVSGVAGGTGRTDDDPVTERR